ncbi:hypothetical protein XENTR_v10024723 [Xenopus tropicalis]|nr:hypothetical protein XENTR_v10024723 [Xenopus tropicalis]
MSQWLGNQFLLSNRNPVQLRVGSERSNMLQSFISIFTLFFLFLLAKANPMDIPKAEPETANGFLQFVASVVKARYALQQIQWTLIIITICFILVLIGLFSLYCCFRKIKKRIQRKEKDVEKGEIQLCKLKVGFSV